MDVCFFLSDSHFGSFHPSGQISIIPKPELRGFWRDSLNKPPLFPDTFSATINYLSSAEAVGTVFSAQN